MNGTADMKRLFRFFLLSGLLVFGGSGCESLRQGNERDDAPPKLTEKTPLPEIASAAAKFGGQTLEDGKKIVIQRKEQSAAIAWAESQLKDDIENGDPVLIANVMNFYIAMHPQVPIKLVESMVTAQRPIVRQMGWKLASQKPSREMAAFIEGFLTQVVWKNNEESVLLPEMAEAVQTNRVKSVYTLLRQGLMQDGSEPFARAMITLDPDRASSDFFDYLAKATIEDLRQLNQKSINSLTCFIILNHFSTHGVDLDHPKFEMLFFYAVSRNQALAQLANSVLEKQMAFTRENLAYTLARLPIWLQMAYVEGARANPNPNVGLFLGDLKKLTAHKEVVEEIDAVTR